MNRTFWNHASTLLSQALLEEKPHCSTPGDPNGPNAPRIDPNRPCTGALGSQTSPKLGTPSNPIVLQSLLYLYHTILCATVLYCTVCSPTTGGSYQPGQVFLGWAMAFGITVIANESFQLQHSFVLFCQMKTQIVRLQKKFLLC